ncbi:unnamed protein product, partial [Nesidiocoris tenuis]
MKLIHGGSNRSDIIRAIYHFVVLRQRFARVQAALLHQGICGGLRIRKQGPE